MSHLATADSDPAFARVQIERFEAATAGYANVIRHIANSAAALRIPESHLDAARCGVALYGMSPFGEPPAVDGLEPVLRWGSYVAQVRRAGGRAEHRATEGSSSRGSRPGSASFPSGTRTASAAT